MQNNGAARFWLVMGFGCLAAGLSTTGCVSLEERDRLQMANRTLEARKTEVETELYDLRAVNQTLRDRLAGLESTGGDKDRLIDQLQAENNSLEQEVAQARTLLEKVAGQGVSPVVVLEKKLPPALDTALQEFARSHPGVVAYDDKHGLVKWVSDVLFVSGSDEVQGSATQALRDFAVILKSPAAADFEVAIVGHTDNVRVGRAETRSKHPTNWHLSAHRAIAVSNLLLSEGYEANRISVTGCGEFRPVADNSSEGGRAQNRRVDIYIVPRGSITAGGGGSA